MHLVWLDLILGEREGRGQGMGQGVVTEME